MDVAIVILNYNGVNFLRQFLPIVEQHSEGARIIVADNASTDNSVEYLQAFHSNVEVICLKENYGFAGGYNIALKEINAQYYLLLNSDVEVTAGWLAPLVKAIQSEETIAAVQPKVLAYHNRNAFEHAGAAGGFIDALGYPFCRGRLFNAVENDHGQYDNTTEIAWATGACSLIRADLFHDFGGFDEDYFAHMEEIDLCWRFRNTGYKIIAEPTATVFHVGGGTLNYQSPKKTYLNFRNSIYTLLKNERNKVWLKLSARLILDGVAGVKFLLDGQFAHTLEILYAHLSFYTNLYSTMHKRNLNKKNWNETNTSGVYPRSIVIAHFFTNRVGKFADIENR